jgi:hypothetical protein
MTLQLVGSPSVESDSTNGDLIIRMYDHGSDTHEPVCEIRVPASDVDHLMRGIVGAGLQCLADSIMWLAAGECATCRNIGMVDEEKNGKPWRVHCPACGPRNNAETALRRMPRIRPSGFRDG